MAALALAAGLGMGLPPESGGDRAGGTQQTMKPGTACRAEVIFLIGAGTSTTPGDRLYLTFDTLDPHEARISGD